LCDSLSLNNNKKPIIPKLKINKAYTDGNGNFVFQDIFSSTITLDIQLEDLTRGLSDWIHEQEKKKSTINIIVLTLSIEKINTVNEIRNLSISDYFGKCPSDWKPFSCKTTIFNLLKEYKEKSGFRINAYFIEDVDTINKDFETFLKLDISPKTILIVDALTLFQKNNKSFAKIFDKKEIGGCIIPNCQDHTKEIKTFIKKMESKVFVDLCHYFNNIFNKQFMNIELCVSTKEEMFRRITNIAIKHLDLAEPILESPWMLKYRSKELDDLSLDIL
jgi:hypothetical protein